MRASFSGFYLAMILVLGALILRARGLQIPQQDRDTRLAAASGIGCCSWRGLVPSLVFGVAFGNLFEGVPFTFDADLRMHSDITLLSLLNPFALLVGLVSLAMIALHGACWLNLKTTGAVRHARLQGDTGCGDWLSRCSSRLAGFWVAQLHGCRISAAR